MSVPAFSDISKSANDLLNKDFYHLSAGTIEVKSNTPNNVGFKVTGKSNHDKATSGALEGKYSDKSLGNSTSTSSSSTPRTLRKVSRRPPTSVSVLLGPIQLLSLKNRHRLVFTVHVDQQYNSLLMVYRRAGLTLTQTWNTANALDTKIEVADSMAKGLKTEALFSFLPAANNASNNTGCKFNVHFKQSAFHGRAFFDLIKGPTANIDAVIGHEGFLAGASAGYNVQKAAVTGYSAAVGYVAPQYSAAITATDNLSVFAASYYHKVNSQVEASAKAVWNSKSGNAVGLEVASKYRLDPVSFAKAKINDRGVAAVSYNVLLRPGVTAGIGASFDTQKIDQATHKVGTSFTFES
ncbi:eukaryotic porin/Tom40 [Xylaria cubensis]|nr:eukaryotic porin/Tom40 [Xylaria cubensis]